MAEVWWERGWRGMGWRYGKEERTLGQRCKGVNARKLSGRMMQHRL